jgi:hypothetical protein
MVLYDINLCCGPFRAVEQIITKEVEKSPLHTCNHIPDTSNEKRLRWQARKCKI